MAIDVKDYPNKIRAGLYANADFKIFYYVFTFEKKKYRGLLNYEDRPGWNKRTRVSVAERDMAQKRADKLDGISDGKVTLDKYFYEYYELLNETAWRKTLVSHYKRYVSPVIGSKPLHGILNRHIKNCIAEQEKLGLSARTVKQTIEALSPVFKDAMVNRIIVFNPMDGVQVKRPNTKKIVTNAKVELKRIYEAICEEFADDAFYKAFYLFALHGRRKKEIMTLFWEDVSFKQQYYIVRDTKNDEEQKFFLDEEIAELLFTFHEKSDKFVFMSSRTDTHIVNIEKVTMRLKKKLGGSFTLHYLRNVLVSALGEDGTKSTFMSGALGHNNTHTLSKYLTLNYQESSLIASSAIRDIVN